MNDLYYIHNTVYSAMDILYAQRSLIECRQAMLSRHPGYMIKPECHYSDRLCGVSRSSDEFHDG